MPIQFQKNIRWVPSLWLGIFLSQTSFAAYSNDIFKLSLEELLNIKVLTGQLAEVQPHKSPAALTIIQRDHIDASPAKNLAELLEIYVPGLMLMAHSEGDKLGLRGNIAAENYKLLLLINGKNITNMVYEGSMTELDQWDLTDIEKVEVVRGPGSVVYGTGAIAGVINIITKSASATNKKTKSSLNISVNPDYRSKGLSYQRAQFVGDVRMALFGSYHTTEGFESPNYYAMAPQEVSNNRFVGKLSSDAFGPQPYLADSFDRPQVKLHLDVRYRDQFKLFTRYTQSGQLHHFRTQSPLLDESLTVIGEKNSRQVSLRSFIFAPEYTVEFNTKSKLKTSITYDTQEYLRYDQANLAWPVDHPNNIKDYAFSQNRWVASTLYSYARDSWELTTGYEYQNIHVGAPWGKSADHIMVREGIYLINDSTTSVYTQDLTLKNRPQPGKIEEIGSGLNFETHSHLFEGNYAITSNSKIQYGHRLDFPDVSHTMYSPRFSVITQTDRGQHLTATAQRALRMMPLRAQYLYDKHGEHADRDHEKIDSLEFAYSHTLNPHSYVTARTFYNDIDAVGFTGLDLQFLANVKLAGLELEGVYKNGSFELLANHSYLKQVGFNMSEELKNGRNRNNISYADYYYVTNTDIPLTLEDYGDGLNNWSENTSKFVLTKKWFGNALSLQLNTQIFWDYRGAYDEMEMYQRAYNAIDTNALSQEQASTFRAQQASFDRERSLLDHQNAYKTQLNVGASLSYLKTFNKSKSLKTTFYVQNLLDTRYRYYVNTGSSNYYPNRLTYLEEPTIFWLKVELTH